MPSASMPLWPGHGQVHHQHVELRGAHQVDRLASAGGFAHHAQVHLFGEELLESRPDDGVVIHNADFDHVVFAFSAACGPLWPIPKLKWPTLQS
jgi:hypothetical protein